MKYIFLSLSLLLFGSSGLFAQRLIEVTNSLDMQGNYVFFCMNRGYCNYILQVSFTNMYNAKADHPLPYLGVVKPGNNRLFKLSKSSAGDSIAFNYKVGYHKGCLHPPVNTDFTYVLPIRPGKEAQVYEISNAGPGTTTSDQLKFYAIRLRMKPGDTIYASRRGTVTEVNTSSSQNDAGTVSTEGWNYAEVVHADCSFARYGVLKKDGSFVRPGQFVEVGDPIGLVGGDQYGRGSDIRLSVYYNQGPDDAPTDGGKPGGIYWVDVPMKFWTKRNGKGMLKHGATYTCELPESLITQEMSPAELKKWKAKHHPAAAPVRGHMRQ